MTAAAKKRKVRSPRQEDMFQLRLLDPSIEPRRKEEMDQWFTDPKLAAEFVDWCRIEPGLRIIEPTAGSGNLVKPLLKTGATVEAYELDHEWVAYLRKHFPEATVHDACDFLTVDSPDHLYDVCAMNPPLSDGLDGVFLERMGLHWAKRTCAIVQTRTLHSMARRKQVWDKVTVTRLELLSDRPSFGRGSPARDFSFVEITRREQLRGYHDRDTVELGFL